MGCHIPATRDGHARGYTLIELMVTIAMIGILAALAIAGYRKWLASARTGETRDLMQTIVQGQHMYKLDTDGYLNCSAAWTNWYPAPPDNRKRLFHDSSHADYACWKLLAPNSSDPIMVGFSVRAGTAADSPPQPLTAKTMNWPTPDGPWFIVHAAADQDADGQYAYWVTSSFQPNQIHGEDVDE